MENTGLMATRKAKGDQLHPRRWVPVPGTQEAFDVHHVEEIVGGRGDQLLPGDAPHPQHGTTLSRGHGTVRGGGP